MLELIESRVTRLRNEEMLKQSKRFHVMKRKRNVKIREGLVVTFKE